MNIKVKSSQKVKLSLVSFVLVFVTWWIFSAVSVYFILALQAHFDITNTLFTAVFLDEKLLACKALKCQLFNNATVFDAILFCLSFFLIYKYFYTRQIKQKLH